VASGSDLEWLAGLCDAEACFFTNMHKTRVNNVVTSFQIGLVRHDVMKDARRLLSEIVGEAIPELHVRPATKTQREFYSLTVAAKTQVLRITETLSPRLYGKRAEALIERDILGRSVVDHQYAATERDRELCDLSHRIKKGEVHQKARVAELLGVSCVGAGTPTAAWMAGMLDGDGSVFIARGTAGSGNVYHQNNVNISSSDVSAITALREAVACRYAVTALAARPVKGGARPNHGFNIVADEIERFLVDLRPYLRVKGAEADVMIDVCRGRMTKDRAYDVLRSLKEADDPTALLAALETGTAIPVSAKRVSRMDQYRRPTYEEMEKRGWWSSEEARKRLGGIGHKAWTTITDGLAPDGTIGNKKYYSPASLREHVVSAANKIVRTDARTRILRAMESWSDGSAAR
jgi:hypothetical protein